MNYSLFFVIALLSGTVTLISGCAQNNKSYRQEKDPQTPDEERVSRVGKLWGPDSISLFGDTPRSQGAADPNLFPINKYLWRATLDALTHLPLRQADAKSGVILTEWYQDPDHPTERIKVDVHITTQALQADGLTVSVFRQKRAGSGQWVDAVMSQDTAEKMTKLILSKARQLKFHS